MNNSDTDRLEHHARRRAGARLGLYIHAFVFFVVMSGLALINFLTSSVPWSLGPFFGWGLGLGVHALAVGMRLSNFKERLVQAELKKLRSQS